jgi:hypothetical protein
MAKKMHKISFYQCHCVDGRATTGIDTHDTTAWEDETPAKGPRDSLILWDWDFRCGGSRRAARPTGHPHRACVLRQSDQPIPRLVIMACRSQV